MISHNKFYRRDYILAYKHCNFRLEVSRKPIFRGYRTRW